ncbi:MULTISPECIES: hydroxyacylglutathione hydrolase [Pseudoalteromonas]|uniref:Hydroxyacylglutathione hydrolase n=1 Tax=Pseudoalteromonas porphyrae TaxID=187330 RepID=A0A0N1MUE3_9GAMM|nr:MULTISPECIES: hydroxyacylglutathione hydrolase [Pseudoalteromonas]KPH63277.1 hydroxyacylglutathione hydrolase [Pseudoalteromonas porphyrae]
MVQVKAIKAFSDNYIWCLSRAECDQVWVVDPGQAEPVLAHLAKHGLTLAGILITHHHYDHTDGIATLCEEFNYIDVYGPHNSPFKGITKPLKDNDSLTVLGTQFTIMTTPGHTLDHICYTHPTLAFTGDTLFSGGCGRLFEGTAQQMYHSFDKLKTLPDDCKIYCTHEYTQANLAFALAVEPNNPDLIYYNDWVRAKRQKNEITLPSTLKQERKINPFMRSDLSSITEYLPKKFCVMATQLKQNNEPWQRFASLRAWKDHF